MPSARRGLRKDTMVDGWRPRRCWPSCPCSLHEVTFADVNGRFVIVAEVFGALWAVFLHWELKARNFGNTVARASDASMLLCCQCRELVVYLLQILCHGGQFQ